MRELVFTPRFDRLFRKLPKPVRDAAYEKLAILQSNPAHPSLRVKPIKSAPGIWEMSVTMSYRITFEYDAKRILLRRIGTHDILWTP